MSTSPIGTMGDPGPQGPAGPEGQPPMTSDEASNHLTWLAQALTDLTGTLPPSARGAFGADAQARLDRIRTVLLKGQP